MMRRGKADDFIQSALKLGAHRFIPFLVLQSLVTVVGEFQQLQETLVDSDL